MSSTDNPGIGSPLLTIFFQELNQQPLPEPLAMRLTTLRRRARDTTHGFDQQRSWMIADWLLRSYTAAWMHEASDLLTVINRQVQHVAEAADQLAALPAIQSTEAIAEARVLIDAQVAPSPSWKGVQPTPVQGRAITKGMLKARDHSGGTAAVKALAAETSDKRLRGEHSTIGVSAVVGAHYTLLFIAYQLPRGALLAKPKDVLAFVYERPAAKILPLSLNLLERLIALES